MNRLRLALAALILPIGLAVGACAPNNAPPLYLNCLAVFGRPGTMGLPSTIGPWAPVDLGDWNLPDWWKRCWGRILIVKDNPKKPGPRGVTPVAISLNPLNCTFDAPFGLNDLKTWNDALLMPNYEVN